MKISTGLLFASVMLFSAASSANADQWVALHKLDRPASLPRQQVKPAADGDEATMWFGYADESASAEGCGRTGRSAVAMEIQGKDLERLAGSKIKAIRFEHGPMNSNNVEDTFNVFITAKLGEENITSKDEKIEDFNWGEQTIYFDEPYTLEADKPVFVGWGTNAKSAKNVYPYAFDYKSVDDYYCDWLGYEYQGSWVWRQRGAEVGNYCIWVLLEGNALPTNDLAITSIKIPNNVEPNASFTVEMNFENVGSNDITEFAIQTIIDGVESDPIPLTPQDPIKKRGTARVRVLRSVDVIGNNIPVTAKILSVNGTPDSNQDNDEMTAYTLSMNAGDGFKRNVLVEEFTGTWCGYCPRGWVGMEDMRAKYTDGTFVPACVHFNDRMATATYNDLMNAVNAQYPSALINRIYLTDPSPDYLEAAYQKQITLPAFAKISVEADYDSETRVINIKSKTRFATPDKTHYIVNYVITSDNLGPYDQQNYYASGNEGPMGGFENMPNPVSLMFNDVALELQSGFKVGEDSVEDGIDYENTSTYTLGEQYDPKNIHVIAMVVNPLTSHAENSVILYHLDGLGVDAIATDNAGEAEYYTLEGLKVGKDALTPGLYIVRKGGKASKVIIR